MVASAGVIAVCNDGVSTPTNVDYGQGGEAVDQSASSPMLSAHKISAILPSQHLAMQMSVISAAKRPNRVVTEKVRKTLDSFPEKIKWLSDIYVFKTAKFLNSVFFSAFPFRPAMDWFMVKSFMVKSESFVGVEFLTAQNYGMFQISDVKIR